MKIFSQLPPSPPCVKTWRNAGLTWTKPGEKILPITGNPLYTIIIIHLYYKCETCVLQVFYVYITGVWVTFLKHLKHSGYFFLSGFSAFHGSSGSWFITELCEVLSKFYNGMDLMQMLLHVNWKVATKHRSNITCPNDLYYDKRYVVPYIVSMLTKDVYFRPKWKVE